MTSTNVLGVIAALQLLGAPHAPAQSPPSVLSVGTCRFSSRAIIRDCRVGYRAFGRLNRERTNAVLIPTWLQGRSEDWLPLLGPTGYVDTSRFYVLVVDALADGHSSSPSNVPRGERAAFADLTLTDMVESQYRLVKRLGIPRLHAVVGVSMGGMQAFEWAARYPTFVGKVVPVVGSPRVPAFDRLLWTTLLSEIERGRQHRAPEDSIWAQLARLEALFIQTPIAVNDSGWARLFPAVADLARVYGRSWSLEDYAAQLRAIARHDIAASFGGDLSRTARQVRPRMLVVYTWDDRMVTADPPAAFAREVGADTLSIPSVCGHLVFLCEQERIGAAVREFLSRDT